MTNFAHRFRGLTPTTHISLTVLLFSISFAWLLPPAYGKENGPVEWLQVVVLGLTALVSISALLQTNLAPARRRLFALTSVIWLLSIARELSWGRTFYTTSTGGIPSLKSLWYGPYVYPSIAVIVFAAFGYFFANGIHKELILWLKQGILPLLDFGIVGAAMFIADMIEHHSGGMFGARTELFEELWELGAYCAVLSFMINVVWSKQFQTDQPTLPRGKDKAI